MDSVYKKIRDWLGIESPQTELEPIGLIEHRLPALSIKRLLALGIRPAEVEVLVIPARRLQRRFSRDEKLTVSESDRIIRLLCALAEAERVYGSLDRALDWLRTPIHRWGGRSPIDLLKTDTGTHVVEETLVQIDEGMYV